MVTSSNSPLVTTTEDTTSNGELSPIVITTANIAPAGELDIFGTNQVTFAHSTERIDEAVNEILAVQNNSGSSTPVATATDPPV